MLTTADSTTNSEANKIKKEMVEEETQKLQSMIDGVDKQDVEIHLKTVSGKPGYAISNYARTKSYDLLVINSPDTPLGLFDRIFTHDIEYILADLPCNLLMVHSRV
jgi:nucleotide-binding universal stress UspA family protein